MTSSSPPKLRPHGFTLVELLVVIGIIALLATILLPMANHAYSQAKRAQMSADLSVISQALEAYRNDFGDYPRKRTTEVTGASLLCWALVAPGPAVSPGNPVPGDGADGPGFRIRGTTGTVKGPYLAPDRFTIGLPPQANASPADGTLVTPPLTFDDSQDVLADRYNHPILYFPANKNADPTNPNVPGAFINNSGGSPQSVFNYGDTSSVPGYPNGFGVATPPNQLTYRVMCFRLGNVSGTGTIVPPAETPITTGPYLLWAAGFDGRFGTADDVADNGATVQLNAATLPNTMP